MEKGMMMNSNEKLARNVVGLETEAKHFEVNGKSAEELWEMEAKMKHNQMVDDYAEKLNKYEKLVTDCQNEIVNDLHKIEMKPLGNNVVIKPYGTNPFQRIQKTESGFIYDIGGQAPEYKSNETGEYEEEEAYVHVGVIVEVSPECKWAHVGDTTMWTKVSEVPLPYFKQNLVLVNENRLMALFNVGLSERECYKK